MFTATNRPCSFHQNVQVVWPATNCEKKCTKLNWLAPSLELHQIQLGCACNFSWTGDIASLGWAQGSLSVWSFNFQENFPLERFSIFVINCYFNTLSSTGTTTHIYLPLTYLVRCPPPYLDLGIYWWIGFSNLEISSIAAWNCQWYSECYIIFFTCLALRDLLSYLSITNCIFQRHVGTDKKNRHSNENWELGIENWELGCWSRQASFSFASLSSTSNRLTGSSIIIPLFGSLHTPIPYNTKDLPINDIQR